MALSDCYATVTTDFGAGGSMYVGGHRGADYRRTARQAIIAYDDMVVESVDHGTGLGWSIGLRRLTIGGFAGYAHCYGVPPVGARFKKGDVITLVAGLNDDHGSLWTGPHIHTTQGDVSAYYCSVGIRPLTDPAPTIAAAISGASVAGGDVVVIDNENGAAAAAALAKRKVIIDMFIVSFYPKYGQVLITAGDGAHALTDLDAMIHRDAGVPAKDYTGDDQNGTSYGNYVETLITDAWARANITRDRIDSAIAETLAQAKANAVAEVDHS